MKPGQDGADALSGRWWVPPDESNAVGGTLSHGPEVWQLSAIGKLGDWNDDDLDPDTPTVIHGTVKGQKISLIGVHLRHTSTDGLTNTVSTTQLDAEKVLYGAHVEGSALFTGAFVRVSHLDDWSNRRAFKMTRSEGSEDLRFVEPERLRAQLPAATVVLEKRLSSSVGLTGASLTAHEGVFFSLNEPKDLEWIEHECVRPLRSLMSLAADEVGQVLQFDLVPEGETFATVNVLSAVNPHNEEKPVHHFEFLFNLSDINFAELVPKWWALYDEIGIVLDLLESLRGPGFISNHFLNAASAIESYHTHRNGRGKMTAEHRALVKRVVNAAQPADQAWLKNQLSSSHWTNFAVRIDEVTTRAGPMFLQAVGDPDAWNRWVRNGRNSVAHRAPEMIDIEEEWRTTVRVTSTMRWVLMLVLLRDLGLPDETIATGVRRNRGLGGASVNLRRIKPDWFAQ